MGFLSKFFEYTLKKNLAKDKSLQQALAEGDKALDDLKKSVEECKRKGIKPSPALKKAMEQFGIKY